MPTIGSLLWRPAAAHPELLAPAVARAIAELGIADGYVASIDPSLADTAAFCAAYAVPLEVSANCVVVSGRRGEQTKTAACLVLATDRADVNTTVRKHLDVRKISFAPMAEAVEQSGMEYGGITPLGLPADWPVLVDTVVSRAGVDRDRQRDPGQQDRHSGRFGRSAARSGRDGHPGQRSRLMIAATPTNTMVTR